MHSRWLIMLSDSDRRSRRFDVGGVAFSWKQTVTLKETGNEDFILAIATVLSSPLTLGKDNANYMGSW